MIVTYGSMLNDVLRGHRTPLQAAARSVAGDAEEWAHRITSRMRERGLDVRLDAQECQLPLSMGGGSATCWQVEFQPRGDRAPVEVVGIDV